MTLAALAIPETMGYTKIAGMPVITGLYTILIPILAFALFGASRHLVVGADSATAAIMFAGIAGLGIGGLQPGSPQWVGLDNFRTLFNDDPLFWTAVRNTLFMTMLMVPLGILLALGLALLATAMIL